MNPATTSPPNPTLTERYIAATVKNLPADGQNDVRTELEGVIADAVEARTENGETPDAAEVAVLEDLGDPAILAARYADRPLHLIGPRYYLTWLRLLKLLLVIVPVCAAGGVALGQALDGAPVGELLGQALGIGIGAGVHVAFWLTLVFAILERTGADTGESWDLSQLPEVQTQGTGRGELIASLVMLGIAAGAVLWDGLRGFVRSGGEAVPILHPDLWPWWIGILLAVLALEAAFAIALYAHGRWTTVLAVLNSALAVISVSWVLTLLGRADLVNPAFMTVLAEHEVDADTQRTLVILLGFTVTGLAAWDVIDGWLKQRRDARTAGSASPSASVSTSA